jgi:hypothetical protein
LIGSRRLSKKSLKKFDRVQANAVVLCADIRSRIRTLKLKQNGPEHGSTGRVLVKQIMRSKLIPQYYK